MAWGNEWRNSRHADKKSYKGGGGRKWSLQLKFGTTPTKVHFATPEKLYVHPDTGGEFPFRPGKRHWVPGAGKRGKGTFIECNEKCVVCAYTNPQAFGLENIAPDPRLAKFNAKPYYAVSGWVEEWHHLVEYYKEDNNPEAGTYTRRERCQGRGCEFCKDNLPKVFGNRFYSTIAQKHWNEAIFRAHEKVERFCKCGGLIYAPSHNCSGCNKVHVDVCLTCDCGSQNIGIDPERAVAVCSDCNLEWSVHEWDNQAIYEQVQAPVNCSCGYSGLPLPVFHCTTEGCETDPFSIFDCQLTLKMSGTDKTSDLVVDDCVIQEPDARLFDPQFQGGDEKAAKVAEWNKEPLDLEEILNSDNENTQAQALGVSNPFGHTGGGQGGQAGGYARYQRPASE